MGLLETVQLNFFKRVLGLQRSTAGYEIRLELNLTRMLIRVFKQAFRFVIKILKMNDLRFPKICLLEQLRLIRSGVVDEKFNWVSQVDEILSTINMQHLWTNLSAAFWETNEDLAIVKLKTRYKFVDLLRHCNSTHLAVNIFRSQDDNTPPYIMSRLPHNIVQTMAQLRLASTNHLSLYIKGVRYTVEQDATCINCNLRVPETVQHILFECPLYQPYRQFYLDKYLQKCVGVDSVVILLGGFDLNATKTVYKFIVNSLRLRAFSLNE